MFILQVDRILKRAFGTREGGMSAYVREKMRMLTEVRFQRGHAMALVDLTIGFAAHVNLAGEELLPDDADGHFRPPIREGDAGRIVVSLSVASLA